MVFIRFAGCPVGCAFCDTDYTVARRMTVDDILGMVSQNTYGGVRWCWITGGEPSLYDLAPLLPDLHGLGLLVAVATAGIKDVPRGRAHGGVDFISVSPHRIDDSWIVRRGDQLNVVPGLNGLKLSDLDGVDLSGFPHRFVTPMADAEGKPINLKECVDFVLTRPGFRLGFQAHKAWGLP